jgi:hypothetical protein
MSQATSWSYSFEKQRQLWRLLFLVSSFVFRLWLLCIDNEIPMYFSFRKGKWWILTYLQNGYVKQSCKGDDCPEWFTLSLLFLCSPISFSWKFGISSLCNVLLNNTSYRPSQQKLSRRNVEIFHSNGHFWYVHHRIGPSFFWRILALDTWSRS